MTILDAAEKVLREAGGPLGVDVLTRRMVDAGLWVPESKTPSASVGSAIYVHIKNGGKTFVKTGRATFALVGMPTDRPDEPTLFDYAEGMKSKKASATSGAAATVSTGYVYILTNPSLKGMVKIGNTRRPVNTRSKELYNTAIPTEFVEFASLKTSKYAQVEELVHRILTKLTRKRVSEKREFYKIKPQEALEILTDVSAVLDPDDRWFHVPGQEVVVKPIKREAPVPKSKSKTAKTGGTSWSGKTQLARLIARRGGNEGAFGGILQYFAPVGSKVRRPCHQDSKWRNLLDEAGVKFDQDDFVIDWECAKNPL